MECGAALTVVKLAISWTFFCFNTANVGWFSFRNVSHRVNQMLWLESVELGGGGEIFSSSLGRFCPTHCEVIRQPPWSLNHHPLGPWTASFAVGLQTLHFELQSSDVEIV